MDLKLTTVDSYTSMSEVIVTLLWLNW